MYKNFLLYGHGGAYNHGSEAIIRCTVDLIKKKYPQSKIILSTHFKDQDIEFGMPVDEYCERDFKYVLKDKNSEEKGLYDHLIYRSTLDKIEKDSVCLSVGGDNYCYNNWHRWKSIHEKALEVSANSILWSCSIEPSMITNEMMDTLRTHHLITARESITYNALKDKGLNNVILCSDIAFLLESKETLLPPNFIEGNTVGINISPLVLRREVNKGMVMENINRLIQYILDRSDMNIALIPHVVMPMDNDYTLLKGLYEELKYKERVSIISDKLSAAEYKYVISKCRFSICARTHASIAAYSSSIPTIAIGYSIKAKGIAKDLGVEDYVLELGEFLNGYSLLNMFELMKQNEYNFSQMLKKKMITYKNNAKVDLSYNNNFFTLNNLSK